jgi:citrate lyase subunit beta/citryl-CoA lyase
MPPYGLVAQEGYGVMLRSWLFAPADDPAKLEKAWTAGADAVILDLEDSVTPPRKAEARVLALAFLRARPQPRWPQVWVRINPLPSGLSEDDLSAIVPGAPDGIVLPKPNSAADVVVLGRRLAVLETAASLGAGSVRILPIATETPQSLFALGSYANVPDRLSALTWGAEDLSVAVGASINRTPDGGYSDLCRLARALCLAAAACADVPAIETVYPSFRDLDGLEAYAAQGRREGFQGMLAIHPAQVGVINRVFTPSDAERNEARRIVALFEANPGVGVLAFEGRMVDAPHLKRAQRLLERGDG